VSQSGIRGQPWPNGQVPLALLPTLSHEAGSSRPANCAGGPESGKPEFGRARPTASRGRRQRYIGAGRRDPRQAGAGASATWTGETHGKPGQAPALHGPARPTASRGRRQRYNGPRSAAADAPGTIQPLCCQERGKVAGRRLFLAPSRGSGKCSAFPQIKRICITECWYQGRSWSSSRFGNGAWETKFMLSMPASKRR